jgi:hypothetical protein
VPPHAPADAWNELAAIAAAGAALVALAALFLTQSWANFHKKLDVTMHFQEAYATLEKEKTKVRSVPDADTWFRRYWHLQVRQYEYWLHGYIRDEIYIFWMACNKSDYHTPRPFVIYDGKLPPGATAYSYAAGWEAARKEMLTEDHPYFFRQFIERVLAHEKESFAKCILDTKKELFGRLVRVNRLIEGLTCEDPRTLFRSRQVMCAPAPDAENSSGA